MNNQEIQNIIDNVSLVDYFFYLEKKGKVKFDKKYGHDHYFLTDENKFSVSDKLYYDFKSGKGGQVIKAVMELENKSWKEAIQFLKEFSNMNYISNEIAEKKRKIKSQKSINPKNVFSLVPNNEKLISYFENRGISSDILKEFTRQFHYKLNGKNYFGIGLPNTSNGIEIRNPMMPMKIGPTGYSHIKRGNTNKMYVFEGMTDMLSFIQLLKQNNRKIEGNFISLNSVTNVDKFIEENNEFNGKMYLVLDGDDAGNTATQKLMDAFSNSKDFRSFYRINSKENNDLNEYLIKKNHNFVEQNYTPNEYNKNKIKSEGVPNSKSMGPGSSKQESGERSIGIEPKQEERGNNTSGQDLFSKNVGDGPVSSSELDPRHRGGIHGRRTMADEGRRRSTSLTTNIPELDVLIEKYKHTKLNNEQVAELVSATCFVNNNQVNLKPNLIITDELIDLVSQYKTGGVEKKGRGILDEYYTNVDVVNSVKGLIEKELSSNKNLSVLEPSVGVGNFLYAVKDNPNANINTFEINETTAKIAKIKFPNVNVNLRSFETEFINDNGFKKEVSEKYDLVIGNPPYGQHRGFYKGLGEESNISRYEDYFVKRSLDVLKENGLLAMVLPSGWLNRQKKLNNSELINAYRLPVGVFEGTKVGTDIIILKKNSLKKEINISDYFENNPQNVLGEIKQRTNQFGKLEDYVHGDLNTALSKIQQDLEKKKIDIIFTDAGGKIEVSNKAKNYERVALIDRDNGKIEWRNNYKDLQEVIDYSQKYKQTQPTLFDFEDNNEKEVKISVTDEKQKEIFDKVSDALNVLQSKKIKTFNVIKEIEKYQSYIDKFNNEDEFSIEELNDIEKQAERILKSKKTNQTKYVVQAEPNISSKTLKYNFVKQDDIVSLSNQSSFDLDKNQIEAFKNSNYEGELKDSTKFFKYANYIQNKWVHDFYYIEGNIYEKLEQLERDKNSISETQYLKQKNLLTSVLPKHKKFDEILLNPNHEFVHKFVLGKVEKQVWNREIKNLELKQVDFTLADKFKLFINELPKEVFQGSSAWEVEGYVDNENVRGSDKERNQLIRERRKKIGDELFKNFLKEELSTEEKNRFANEFNKKHNNIYIPNYSQFPLFSNIHQNFKGKPLELSVVQKAGIGRLTTKGVGLLAHEVGFGKTLSGILAMHEAMQRGFAKRPLIVVPNDSIMKQWIETIAEVIPNAKVNVLGNLGTKYDLSNFENEDNEITIITYSGFGNIGFSKEITDNLAKKFSYISETELNSLKNTEREIQQDLTKTDEIKGKMKRGKIYDWEDFGFDHLTFDEVHNANHIVSKVNINDRTFASDFRSQNQRTSLLGINTWMACQYIQEKHQGRNISLLSATPFTNKPLEYYSILSLIANNRLEEKGYFNVNTFFETFMEADNEMEIDAKGEVKYKSDVKRFKNNSLFQQLLGEFIDIKGEEDNPELVRPNRINKEYKFEQNELTKEQYDVLSSKFDPLDKGSILKHILNARLIAISPYLSPYLDDEPDAKMFVENSPKLKNTVDLIIQNNKDNPNAGQIIYSELAVDKFDKIAEYLVKFGGFERKEVEIITGSVSKKKREDIQEKFNDGKIKVIIGSSAIKEGMNLQERTSDMYLLTLPYNFTALRQVEGRAWRQGNMFENVRINYMLLDDSIDVFMLQKLQAKQSRYLEAMKKDLNILDVSDINTEELKTALITDIKTRVEIEEKVEMKRLEHEQKKLVADSSFILRKYESLKEVKSKIEERKLVLNNHTMLMNSNDGDDKSYWKSQIENDKLLLNKLNEKLSAEILKLEKNGIDVKNITSNLELKEKQIKEIEQEMRQIHLFRSNLFDKYQKEKREKEQNFNKINYVKERAEENKSFYKIRNTEEKEEKKKGYTVTKAKIIPTYEGIKVQEVSSERRTMKR